jgi:hypothetical protein
MKIGHMKKIAKGKINLGFGIKATCFLALFCCLCMCPVALSGPQPPHNILYFVMTKESLVT